MMMIDDDDVVFRPISTTTAVRQRSREVVTTRSVARLVGGSCSGPL